MPPSMAMPNAALIWTFWASPSNAANNSSRALGRVQQRLLVCGNLLTWGQHGVAFAPGQNPAEIWPAVAEALYRIRRADKLLGDMDLQLVKDVTPIGKVGDTGFILMVRTKFPARDM